MAKLCLRGGIEPIILSALPESARAQLIEFNRVAAAVFNLSSSVSAVTSRRLLTQSAVQYESADSTTPDQLASETATAYLGYQTTRQSADSLRVDIFGSDASLEANSADSESSRSDGGLQTPARTNRLDSTGTVVLLIVLLVVGFLPWAFFRAIPARVASLLDRFSMRHSLEIGEASTKQPTQFGAAVSWSALCVALLVAIFLGTASNVNYSTNLLPPSAEPLVGTAQADFEITLRAYASAAEVVANCPMVGPIPASSSNIAWIKNQTGFTGEFTVRTQPAGGTGAQACGLAFDCKGCGVRGAVSSLSLQLPYPYQLVEFEIWVPSSNPGTWSRRGGLLSQLPGQMLAAESALRFSVIESYFSDERSQSKSSSGYPSERSGYELEFTSYEVNQPQDASQLTAQSHVTLSFVFAKSDIVFRSRATDLLSPLQILTGILSTVVSLFSVFAIIFTIAEQRGLHGCCKRSAGRVSFDKEAKKYSIEEATPADSKRVEPISLLRSISTSGSGDGAKVADIQGASSGSQGKRLENRTSQQAWSQPLNNTEMEMVASPSNQQPYESVDTKAKPQLATVDL